MRTLIGGCKLGKLGDDDGGKDRKDRKVDVRREKDVQRRMCFSSVGAPGSEWASQILTDFLLENYYFSRNVKLNKF